MSKALTSYFHRLKNSIKQSVVSALTDDSEAYPRVKVEYNGKTTNAVRLSPYGLDSNPPKDAFCLLLSSQGQESVKFGLISDFLNRKKGLAEGETVLYNTVTGDYVFLKSDGSIEIVNTSGGNIKIASDGKISVLNGSDSLYDIITQLIDEVKDLKTFGSPTNHTVLPASQALLDAVQTRLDTLME